MSKIVLKNQCWAQKKVLSLVLCVAAMLSVMVLGAGAAFSDQDKIENTEAVDACSALNIIGGYEDGSYHPERNIKRSEVTKMICVALNGGKEPNLSVPTTPTFTDVRNTSDGWAEKYIESCVAQGIVSGVGGDRFSPAGNVTGSQLAKMLLVCLGYDSDIEKFTGGSWDTNVNVIATQKGIYEGLESMDVSAAVTRDQTAQMVWNALQAKEVGYTYTLVSENGQLISKPTLEDKATTLLQSSYSGASIYEGVLTGSGEYAIENATGGKDKVAMNLVEKLNGVILPASGDGSLTNQSWEYTEDASGLVGQYVKVLVNNKGVVYGVFPVEDKNTVVETTVNATDYTGLTDKVKVDGTTYGLESDIETYLGENNLGSNISTCKANTYNLNSANKVVFIDNDDNGKFDFALVTPVNVVEVTFMNSTNLTMSVLSSVSTPINGLSQEISEMIVSDGLAKGDYAILTPSYYADKDTLTKVEVASGSVTGVRGNAAPYTDYQIADEWVKPATGYSVNTTIKSGSTVNYVAVDGVLYYAKLTSGATLENVAVISEMGVDTTALGFNTEAKIVLSDGSTKKVTVGALYDDVTEAADNLDNDNNTLDAGEQKFIGVPVSYEINNDGEYEFYLLANTTDNKAGFDTVLLNRPATYVAGSWTIDGTPVADDALVVVRNAAVNNNSEDGEITTLTGAEFKKVTGADSNGNGTGTYKFDNADGAYALVGKDSDGFTRVMFAVVQATAGATAFHGYNQTNDEFTLGVISGDNYGYLTKDSWYETIDGSNYNCFEIWNGEDTVIVKEKATKASYAKRTIITFDVVGDGIIKNVTNTAAAASYITAYTAGNAVEIGGTEYDLTSDSVILNINDNDAVGVAGDSIVLAREISDSGFYYANAYFKANGAGEIEILVVDVTKNELVGSPVMASTASLSGSGVQAALNTLNNVTLTGNNTISGAFEIKAGQTLTVTGALTLDADVTGAGKLVIGTIGANTASHFKCSSIEITGSTGAARLEQIPGVAGMTVKLGAQSSDNAKTADKWFTTSGKATGETANTGAVSTAVTTTAQIQAGTYKYGTYGFSTNNLAAADQTGWFLLDSNGNVVVE